MQFNFICIAKHHMKYASMGLESLQYRILCPDTLDASDENLCKKPQEEPRRRDPPPGRMERETNRNDAEIVTYIKEIRALTWRKTERESAQDRRREREDGDLDTSMGDKCIQLQRGALWESPQQSRPV